MTRDEIRQQYFAERLAPASGPDPSASGLTQIMQGGLSQPMNQEEMAAAYAPDDPREAIAGGFGKALGIADEQRYNALNEAHPNLTPIGYGAGLGLELALGGVGVAGLARAGARPLASVLSKGGKVAETLAEPAAVVHGSKHLELAMKYGGRAARAGAERLRGNPEGARELLIDAIREKSPQLAARFSKAEPSGFQGTGNPFSGPAPNASIRGLSPEMQAKSDAYQAFLRRHSLNQ